MYSEEDEIRLINMQKSWYQSRRSSSSAFSLLGHEEPPELFPEKSLGTTSSDTSYNVPIKNNSPPTTNQLGVEEDIEETSEENAITAILDASKLGDIPAKYVIHQLAKHQHPVVGVYVDRRIIPGFKYSIIPLCSTGQKKYLFKGRGLTLKSIGRGYARRLTFVEDDASTMEQTFWSDNNQGGYAFELRAVSIGDKFTVYDVNHEAQGILEVLNVDEKQIEIDESVTKRGFEKRVKVKMTATVEFYDGVSQTFPISGVAIYVKKHGEKSARVVKIRNININHHKYYLIPGFEKSSRWIKVNGNEINDVPTNYTIKGIESHELPAIGTYVDPRILPGFVYKVRPVNSKRYLFNGNTLKLLSIGQGYAKRFTFESNSKLTNDNFFWSDSNLEGFAFETQAVYNKMRFSIISANRVVGEAKVFRFDLPQQEHSTNKERLANGEILYVKQVRIDLLCHVKLDVQNSGSVDESLMRVHGLGVLTRKSNQNEAKLDKIKNVALDSQVNLLFAHANTNITFIPLL